MLIPGSYSVFTKITLNHILCRSIWYRNLQIYRKKYGNPQENTIPSPLILVNMLEITWIVCSHGALLSWLINLLFVDLQSKELIFKFLLFLFKAPARPGTPASCGSGEKEVSLVLHPSGVRFFCKYSTKSMWKTKVHKLKIPHTISLLVAPKTLISIKTIYIHAEKNRENSSKNRGANCTKGLKGTRSQVECKFKILGQLWFLNFQNAPLIRCRHCYFPCGLGENIWENTQTLERHLQNFFAVLLLPIGSLPKLLISISPFL